MKKTFVVLGSVVFALCSCVASAQSVQQSSAKGLSTDTVVRLLQEGLSSESVLKIVGQNSTSFVMSVQSIKSLQQVGASDALINAMLAGRKSSGADSQPANHREIPNPLASSADPPQTGSSVTPTPPNISPGPPPPGPTSTPSTPGSTPAQVIAAPASTGSSNFDVAKLRQARAPITPPAVFSAQPDEKCTSQKRNINVDVSNGSKSASRLTGTGSYCFRVSGLNPLYDWAIALNVVEPTGNPLDLLNDAISSLKNLATGAAAQQKQQPNPSCRLGDVLGPASASATALQQALTALLPQKDSNGKYQYVQASVTLSGWTDVQKKIADFQQKVTAVQGALPSDNNAEACSSDQITTAVTLITDTYPKVSQNYNGLVDKLSQSRVKVQNQELEATDTADLVVTPSYLGTALNATTFHFNPSFGIVSASAGFLMTQVPAPTYNSATAPDPNDLTKTQNVLQVNYGAGIRPALVAMLTGNIPQVNTRNFGLGVSSGLVFDITSGKADTSSFGYFGGVSLRLTPWIYLTPGVHVGQYANWPPGFTHAGQVIPPNTGTPNPTKQYTARFAFSVTYIIKNLGQTSGGSQGSNPAK